MLRLSPAIPGLNEDLRPTDILFVDPCLAGVRMVEFPASLSVGLKYEIDDCLRDVLALREIRAVKGTLL